jgi:sugar phosphate permease
LLLTALGIGLGLPTASIAITSGVQPSDQGLAGAIFTTSQQAGAAVGLAILATAAAAKTHASGSLVAGYRLSFLISGGIAVFTALFVLLRLRSSACQKELVRQQAAGESPGAGAGAMIRRA